MSAKRPGDEDEKEVLLSSASLSVRGTGVRLLTNSYSVKQCSIRRCAKSIGDIYCRFVVSVSSLKVFPSSSMSMDPKPGDIATNEELVITLHDDTLELRFKFDDAALYSLWQRALGEAIATAHCTEAFTTFSPTGRLSYYRLNRTMYACSGLVPFEHRCMNRGRFLLTARRQLSELLLRFRDAGCAFVAQSEVACLLRYCKQDPLLSCDSDVALMEKILTLMPAAASYSSSSLAAKQADERIDEVLACAALDELQDEQNGLFAYGTQSPSADSPASDPRFSASASGQGQEQGQDEQRDGILEEKLAAMQGDFHAVPAPAPASPSRTGATRPQAQALSPLLTLTSLTSETPFRPFQQRQQQEQLDADFALAMAVQINDCSSPLPTALVTLCSAAPAPAPAPASSSAAGGSLGAGGGAVGAGKDKDGPRSPSPTSVTQVAALDPPSSTGTAPALATDATDSSTSSTEASSSSSSSSSVEAAGGNGNMHAKIKAASKQRDGAVKLAVTLPQALAFAGALALLLLACACSYLGRAAPHSAPLARHAMGQRQGQGQGQGWGHKKAESSSFDYYSAAAASLSSAPALAPAQAPAQAQARTHSQAPSTRRGPALHSSPSPRASQPAFTNAYSSSKAEGSGAVSLAFSPVAVLRRLVSRVLGWVGALVFTLPGSSSSSKSRHGHGQGQGQAQDGGLFSGVAKSWRWATGSSDPDDIESWVHKSCASISCHEDFPSPVTGLMG